MMYSSRGIETFSVSCDEAMLAANTLLWCVEERDVDYEKIVLLKDVQDRVIIDNFKAKNNS